MKITRSFIYRITIFLFASVCLTWLGIFLCGMIDVQRLTSAAEHASRPLELTVLMSCKRIDLYETDLGDTPSLESPNRSIEYTNANFGKVLDWLKAHIVGNSRYEDALASGETNEASNPHIVLYSGVGAGAAQKLMMQFGAPMIPDTHEEKKLLKVLPLAPGCMDSYQQHMMELRQLMPPMSNSMPVAPMAPLPPQR